MTRTGRRWSGVIGVAIAAAVGVQAGAASANTTLATGLPATVKVSMRGSAIAWSEPGPNGRFRLMIRVAGVVRPAAVATSPVPFDVDLGDDGHGHLLATYSRCTPRCDVFAYAVSAAREWRVAGLGRGSASDVLPTAARGRIAFARSVRGRQPRVYVRSLTGGRLRALPFGASQRGSGPTRLDLGTAGLAFAWQRPADYGSQQVRYDPLKGGSKVLATYYGGALAGTDVVGLTATPTGVLWGAAGYGESIGTARLFLVAPLNESSRSRDLRGSGLTAVAGESLERPVALTCEMQVFGPGNCSVVLLDAVT